MKERYSPQRADKGKRKTVDRIDSLSRKLDSLHQWFFKLGPRTLRVLDSVSHPPFMYVHYAYIIHIL